MAVNVAETKKSGINRRQFLGIAWGGSLLVLGGQIVAGLLRYVQPVASSGFGGVVRAGKVAEFAPGTISLIKAGRFFLYRLQDGSFLAMWQKCTHLGCTVPWVEDEKQFHCPCHGSLFDQTGQVTGGPAPRPLDVFPVTIKDGDVYVDTGNATQRNKFDPSQTTKA
jgi:cytochrome b6-f complex iron-sulfur subunit